MCRTCGVTPACSALLSRVCELSATIWHKSDSHRHTDAPCHNSGVAQLPFTFRPTPLDVRRHHVCSQQRRRRERQRCPRCAALGRFQWCAYRSPCAPISQMSSLHNDSKLAVTPLRCSLLSNTRFRTSEQPHKWVHQMFFFFAHKLKK